MEIVNNEVRVDTGSKFLAKVFLYMFIALFITASVATGVGYLFLHFLPLTGETEVVVQNTNIYIGLLIGSLVLLIFVGIWFNVRAFKMERSLALPFAIYAILLGIAFSSFVMWVPPYILGLAFGITCLVFGSMAIIGYFAKGDMAVLWTIILGALTGISTLALVNLIWFFVFPASFQITFLIIQVAIFAVIMLITIIDVHNIKQIAMRGSANNNIVLFCAFSLYIDFINIFLRVLYFLLLALRRS